MAELLIQAGFSLSSNNEDKKEKKEDEPVDEIHQKIADGKLLEEDELEALGFIKEGLITQCLSRNNVAFYFYGGNLSDIEVDGVEISELFKIPDGNGPLDDLCYRITKEALIFAYEKAGLYK